MPLFTADDLQVIGLTLCTASFSTLIIFPFGVGLAWLLARKNWPGKTLIETVVALPLVMPPVATGLILLNLLGRHGPLGAFLRDTFGTEIVFTWKAVVAAMAVLTFLPEACLQVDQPDGAERQPDRRRRGSCFASRTSA